LAIADGVFGSGNAADIFKLRFEILEKLWNLILCHPEN
jgi:hypothetical protein